MSYAYRVADLISIVLVAAIAIAMAELTWRLAHDRQRSFVIPQASIPTPAPRESSASHYRQVAALHLFGSSMTTPDRPRPVPVAAPQTSLQLNLRGVLASGDATSDIAIIADDRGRELPYRVGDAINDRVTIKAIQPQRVLLDHAGRDEVLELPAKRLNGENVAASEGRRSPDLNTKADRSGAVSRNLIKNPGAIARYIALQPVNLENGSQGYRVSPREEGLLFEEAGLEQGDVIVAVNGITFDDPEALGKLLMELNRSDHFTLDLINGGSRQNLSIRLE